MKAVWDNGTLTCGTLRISGASSEASLARALLEQGHLPATILQIELEDGERGLCGPLGELGRLTAEQNDWRVKFAQHRAAIRAYSEG